MFQAALAAGGEGEGFDPGAVDHHGFFLRGGFAEFAGSGVWGFQLGDPATDGVEGCGPALNLLVAVLVQWIGFHGGAQH
jgi:hypothetical protein